MEACQYLYLHTSGWSDNDINWPDPTGKGAHTPAKKDELCQLHTTQYFLRVLNKMSKALGSHEISGMFSCDRFSGTPLDGECSILKSKYMRSLDRCSCKHYKMNLENKDEVAGDPNGVVVPIWKYTEEEDPRAKSECISKHRMQPHKWVNLYFFTYKGGISVVPE